MMMYDINDKFYRDCGEIIRLALVVESDLEHFISNYFCHPQNQKTFRLNDLITLRLSFARKTDIFKEICIEEGMDEKEVKDIVKSIDFVRINRNKVAHFDGYIGDPKDGIKLRKRTSTTYKKDELKITDEFVKEVDEKRLFAIQGIHRLLGQITKS